MIFSFLPGNGRHFIGNIVCSPDISVMKLIHILHFFTIDNVFKNPQKKKSRGMKCGEQRVKE
jgi:energy-converting hydrogenase Eha subunit B